jgi:hypothetical protein
MKYHVVLSREGRVTIEEQVEWYHSDGQHGEEALASRWLDKLHPELGSLSEMPAKHGLAPENNGGILNWKLGRCNSARGSPASAGVCCLPLMKFPAL